MSHSFMSVSPAPDPDLDFPDLTQRAWMRHQISPVQLRLDVTGREVGAQFEAPGVPRCKKSKILFRKTQRTFEHRFIPAMRYKAQNIVFCEKVFTFEQRMQGKPELQIVCSQDERERLAGRVPNSPFATRTPPNSVNLRSNVLFLVWKISNNWGRMRGMRPQDDRNSLNKERYSAGRNRHKQTPNRPGGAASYRKCSEPGFRAEIELEPFVQQLSKPGEFLFQVAGTLLGYFAFQGFSLFYHSTCIGSSIQGIFTPRQCSRETDP